MIKETMASIRKVEKEAEEIVNKANEDAENNIKKANEDAQKSITDAQKRQKDKIEEYCQKARERGKKESDIIRSDSEKNIKALYGKALVLENEAVNKAVEEVMKF